MKVLLLLLVILVFILFKRSLNLFTNTIPTPIFYVINVEGAKGEERRKYIKNIMDTAGIKYEFYPAHNKDTIDMSRYKKDPMHWELTRGEVALAMTHNDLYKKLLESDHNYMIIAEDDFTVRPNFKHYYDYVMANLPLDFDIVKIEYINKFEGDKYTFNDKPEVPSNNDATITFKTNVYHPGSAGYIVSRKGAEYLLKLNEPIWLASDQAFEGKWQEIRKMGRPFKEYYVDPLLAWQSEITPTGIHE